MQHQYTNLLDLIPTREANEYQVRLNTNTKPLFIGRLNLNDEGRYCTRKREDIHLHVKSNGICINAALLWNPEYNYRWIEIDFIRENGTQEKLVTSRKYFQAKGRPFCYKGYEPQATLELSLWGKEKALQFERELNSQTELFSGEAA
jgi:hypothetical protein